MPYKDPEKGRAYARRYYARRKNEPDFKIQLKDIAKRYRERHLEQVRESDKLRKRKARAKNPEKSREANRRFCHKYRDKIRSEASQRYWLNPEKVRGSNRKSYQKHIVERRKSMNEHRKNLSKEQKAENYALQMQWRKENPLRLKECYFARRFQILGYYTNNTFRCAHCGISHIPFLTIDHILGRKIQGHSRDMGTEALHRFLIKNQFPPGFQILCNNCNMIKEIKRERNYSQTPDAIKKRGWKKELKFELFSHYSNGIPKCDCCGYSNIDGLSIDHINGRRSHGHSRKFRSIGLYSWLKRTGYPKNFRVLCLNCNAAIGINRKCPHQK